MMRRIARPLPASAAVVGVVTAAALGLGAVAGCGEPGRELELVGLVERSVIELVAPRSETLVAVEAERGQSVAAGHVVVSLDPTLAEADLAGAEAALAGARTADRVAGQELARLRALRRDNVASAQALERAELGRDEAAARLREAQAGLAAARKHLADLRLAAPGPAVVDQLPFEVGERVPAGAVVAVLLAKSAPWVRVWVPEDAYARVSPGTPARVAVDGVPGVLEGRVLDLAREPEFTPHYALTERDRVHLVYEARVEIRGAPPNLRPGIPAEVVLLPRPAMQADPTPGRALRDG